MRPLTGKTSKAEDAKPSVTAVEFVGVPPLGRELHSSRSISRQEVKLSWDYPLQATELRWHPGNDWTLKAEDNPDLQDERFVERLERNGGFKVHRGE